MKILFCLVLVLALNGCSNNLTLEEIRDTDFSQGCILTKAGVNLGAFNKGGDIEVFKFKCSSELPENFMIDYKDKKTGYHISVNTEQEEQF